MGHLTPDLLLAVSKQNHKTSKLESFHLPGQNLIINDFYSVVSNGTENYTGLLLRIN